MFIEEHNFHLHLHMMLLYTSSTRLCPLAPMWNNCLKPSWPRHSFPCPMHESPFAWATKLLQDASLPCSGCHSSNLQVMLLFTATLAFYHNVSLHYMAFFIMSSSMARHLLQNSYSSRIVVLHSLYLLLLSLFTVQFDLGFFHFVDRNGSSVRFAIRFNTSCLGLTSNHVPGLGNFKSFAVVPLSLVQVHRSQTISEE